jgi:hypothetical protein
MPKYFRAGTNVLGLPAEMVFIDKKNKEHLLNTLTKKHHIASHYGVNAIDLINRGNTVRLAKKGEYADFTDVKLKARNMKKYAQIQKKDAKKRETEARKIEKEAMKQEKMAQKEAKKQAKLLEREAKKAEKKALKALLPKKKSTRKAKMD